MCIAGHVLPIPDLFENHTVVLKMEHVNRQITWNLMMSVVIQVVLFYSTSRFCTYMLILFLSMSSPKVIQRSWMQCLLQAEVIRFVDRHFSEIDRHIGDTKQYFFFLFSSPVCLSLLTNAISPSPALSSSYSCL